MLIFLWMLGFQYPELRYASVYLSHGASFCQEKAMGEMPCISKGQQHTCCTSVGALPYVVSLCPWEWNPWGVTPTLLSFSVFILLYLRTHFSHWYLYSLKSLIAAYFFPKKKLIHFLRKVGLPFQNFWIACVVIQLSSPLMACTPKRAEMLHFSIPPVFAHVKRNCGHFCCVSCFLSHATVSAHTAKSRRDPREDFYWTCCSSPGEAAQQ